MLECNDTADCNQYHVQSVKFDAEPDDSESLVRTGAVILQFELQKTKQISSLLFRPEVLVDN